MLYFLNLYFPVCKFRKITQQILLLSQLLLIATYTQAAKHGQPLIKVRLHQHQQHEQYQHT